MVNYLWIDIPFSLCVCVSTCLHLILESSATRMRQYSINEWIHSCLSFGLWETHTERANEREPQWNAHVSNATEKTLCAIKKMWLIALLILRLRVVWHWACTRKTVFGISHSFIYILRVRTHSFSFIMQNVLGCRLIWLTRLEFISAVRRNFMSHFSVLD